MAPRGLPDPPKEPQEGSKTLQKSPKRAPRGPQEGPKMALRVLEKTITATHPQSPTWHYPYHHPRRPFFLPASSLLLFILLVPHYCSSSFFSSPSSSFFHPPPPKRKRGPGATRGQRGPGRDSPLRAKVLLRGGGHSGEYPPERGRQGAGGGGRGGGGGRRRGGNTGRRGIAYGIGFRLGRRGW